MSYAALVEFEDGVADEITKFSNSWRGAAAIWKALFDKYVPKKHQYDNWLFDDEDRLWKLHKDPRLSDYERLVHLFCYDDALLYRADFKAMSNAFRQFHAEHKSDSPDHWLAWADFIENSQASHIGLYGTSVSENPRYSYDEDKDEDIPYNVDQDKHWNIFAEYAAIMRELQNGK